MVKASAMTNDVVDKSTDHTKPPLICFLTTILILKLIETLMPVVWFVYILINNVKLANVIRTSLPIVVKINVLNFFFSK